ncbi:MAG: YIP1 family protein [Myxococcales bacterium]
MICPRCQSPLEDSTAKFCPLCGASVIPPPQPQPPPQEPATPGLGGPTWKPEPVSASPHTGSAQPPPASPSTAHCAVHADRTAVDICSRCGTFACRECLVIGKDGQGVCSACLARQGGEAAPLPWEQRSELGFFKAYWETAKAIMFSPQTAFERVQPETGKWWDPLSFAIISNFLAASGTLVVYGFAALFGALAAVIGAGNSGSSDLSAPAFVGVVALIVIGTAIIIPINSVLFSFLVSGVEHLTLKLVGVQTRPFEASLRVVCYGHAPMFWGVVPFCSGYAYPVWMAVCLVFGHKAIHRTTGGKAAAGVLLPGALCCGAAAVVYGIFIAAVLAGKN